MRRIPRNAGREYGRRQSPSTSTGLVVAAVAGLSILGIGAAFLLTRGAPVQDDGTDNVGDAVAAARRALSSRRGPGRPAGSVRSCPRPDARPV